VHWFNDALEVRQFGRTASRDSHAAPACLILEAGGHNDGR